MRILHAISSLNPAAGGPPVVAVNLAKAQSELGCHVHIGAEDIPTTLDVPNISWPRQGLSALLTKPSSAILDAVQSADVCHLHGVWEPLLLQVARAARQLNRPYVVTPHGMLDPWSLAQKKLKKQMALALGFRSMLDHAALIHALNDDEKRLLEPLKIQAPCAVIPNGIFLEELQPIPTSDLFRNHTPGPGARRYVLFLSRLHYKKGLDVLIDAFADVSREFPNVDLVVAGPDGGEAETTLIRAKKRTLEHRVWLTGPLYGALKWSALAGASCFCLPSRQEGFSVAILEAMASGIPVVVSDQCHFPEVAEVEAGIIVPVDASDTAQALKRILQDETTATRMGQAGRKLVEERFTWKQVADHCLEQYQRLVSAAKNT